MIKSNFFPRCSNIFAKFQRFSSQTLTFETDTLALFQNSISQSVSILAIVSHACFLMSFNHFSSTALQIKPLFFSFQWSIDACLRFPLKIMLKMVTVLLCVDCASPYVGLDVTLILDWQVSTSSTQKSECKILGVRAVRGNVVLDVIKKKIFKSFLKKAKKALSSICKRGLFPDNRSFTIQLE